MTVSAAEFMASTPRSTNASDAWAEDYGRELRGIVTRYANQQPRSVQKHLGPSELGERCDRLVVGKMAGSPRTNHVSDPWASMVGTAVHAYLADAFTWDNVHNGYLRWLTEHRVVPDPGPNAHPGTADLYDAFNRAVVDHKGIAVSTPVPTPSGWTTMGELREGDEVFGADGRVCRVTRTYPVQYRECFRVKFKTGELITDDVQQFEVLRNRNGGHSTKNPERVLLSAREMRAQLRARSGQRHLRVRNCGALDLPDRELPVHPYVLGCWLGDGYHGGGQIGKPDAELFDNIRSYGYELGKPPGEDREGILTYTVLGLLTQLQELGLVQREASTGGRPVYRGVKRIPDSYLRASARQRLALLQGLMDSDGSHNQARNQCVFTSTSESLALQVTELAGSLGWKAYQCSFAAHGFGVETTAYQVMFTPLGANPFRLTRKARLVQPKRVAGADYRVVQEVTKVPTVATRCIDVDSPDHLYLATREFIPVHNCQGESTRSKLKSSGPPRHYFVQLLLYRRGYLNLGLPVDRVAIVSWPRTKSTLDEMYVWSHVPTPDDDRLVDDVLVQTRFREEVAQWVRDGRMSLMDVPAVPDDHSCYFCPFYRPQAAYDGAYGCPGTITRT